MLNVKFVSSKSSFYFLTREMTKSREELKKNKKKRGDEDSDDESSISEGSKVDMDSRGSGKLFNNW